MTTSEASSRDDDGQQQKGLLGSLFGGKKVSKAKLGLEMQMYYNEELKCWVMPGEEEEKRKELEGLRAPPQMPASSSSMTGQQSSMGGAQTTSSLSSRYAAMPTMSVGGSSQQQGSILAGLKPPPLGGGAGMAQQPFKPMAVFNPSSSGNVERKESTTSIWQQQQQEVQHQEDEASVVTDGNDSMDPLALEVLSFWSYYRENGYDVDVMNEWVRENYSDEVCNQLDCEELLKDEGIASAVAVYMEHHKQGEEISPQDHQHGEEPEEEQPSYQEQQYEEQPSYQEVEEYHGVVGEAQYEEQYQDQYEGGHVHHDGNEEYATMEVQEHGDVEHTVSHQVHDEQHGHSEYDTYHYSALRDETVEEQHEAYAPNEGGFVTPAIGASPEKQEQSELNEFGLPVPSVYAEHKEQDVMYTNNAMFDESAQGWNASPGSVGTLSSHGDADAMQEIDTAPPPPPPTETEQDATYIDYNENQMSNMPIPSGIIDSAEIGGYGDVPEMANPQETVLASRATLQELEDVQNTLQQANATIEEKREEIIRIQNCMDVTIEEKNTVIAELEESLDGVRAEMSALQAELDGQKAAAQDLEDRHGEEVAELKQRIFDLEGESEELKSRLQELESESEKLHEAKQKIEILDQQLESLSKSEDAIGHLESENERLVAELRSFQDDSSIELEKLVQEKQALETSLKEEMISIQNDFQTMLDERDAEIMQLEARVMLSENAVHSAKEEARQEITAEMKASFEEDKAEYEALLESKEVELADYLNRVQEQEKKFAAAKKKIQAQASQIEKLTEEMDLLREKEDSNNAAQEHLESIVEECNELKAFVDTLQQRMCDAEGVHVNEIETLVQENSQLMDALSEKEDHLEQMNAELAQLRSSMEQAQSLESQISHWEEAASAAQDALMAEKEAKDMAHAQYTELEQRLQEVTQNLHDAQAQSQQAVQLQSDLEHKHEQILTLHNQCEEYEMRLQEANMTIENAQAEIEELSRVLQENPPGAAHEELESEIKLLRHQLAAHSEGASHKEEELRKYKLQLVKAKKLRAHDQERIEELQELQEEYEAKLQAAAEAMNAENNLTAHTASLHQELEDVRAESKEHEESLNDALTALGQEEAKVSRLVELLSIAGLTDAEIQQELDAVADEVGYDIL